ncbi:MAG: methyltransferase domain-containing protein [Chitinivibrionales bacterium]|nr:methyltransferase domain-containing protein [Chitinivibrionales bacterium]MBD3357193.1 methyltransferase domain-containing protein [Chitinivibrionales bacterium]
MTQHLPGKKSIAQSFSRKAASYGANARVQRNALLHLVRHLSAYPPDRSLWIDLGCGPGLFASLLPPNFRPDCMLCLDIAPGALREIRNSGLSNVRCVRGDIDALPLRSHCCDMIIMTSVLQWIADPKGTVRRCAQLLRPGGQFVFSIFLGKYLCELAEARRSVGAPPLPIHRFERAEFDGIVQSAGLEILWEEHLHEVRYFSSAMNLIKHLTGIGAGATRKPSGRPARLFQICRAYEECCRTEKGVPATSDVLVGSARYDG